MNYSPDFSVVERRTTRKEMNIKIFFAILAVHVIGLFWVLVDIPYQLSYLYWSFYYTFIFPD
jgi:hypothetical protein